MNPRLKSDEWFREIMHRRQKVHRMFNLIKCRKVWSFFQEDPEDAKLSPQERKYMDISGCKNLILKEAIFTCDQIQNMHLLDLKLRILEQKLTNHIMRDCNKCEYIGEKCQFCKCKVLAYEADAAQCYFCFKTCHRKVCLDTHIKNAHPDLDAKLEHDLNPSSFIKVESEYWKSEFGDHINK